MTYIDEYRNAYADDSDQTTASASPPRDDIRSLVAAARTIAKLERERDALRAELNALRGES